MTRESATQRDVDAEIGELLMFKMKHNLCRYRLRHSAQMDDKVAALELMARYKAIAEMRQEVKSEPAVTGDEVRLKIIK